MKNRLTKLNEFQLTLLLSGIFGILIIGLSCIGLGYGQPGWLIGAAIGTVATFISVLLVNITSTATLKGEKSGLFIVSYFLRMILFVGLFAMLVVFQYTLEIEIFKNSFWGMAIAFFPSTLITIIVQLILGKRKDDGQVH